MDKIDSSKIKDLADLKREKERLKRQADLTLVEMQRSLRSIKSDGQKLLVNKMLVPAGAAGLTALGVRKWYQNATKHNQEYHYQASNTESSDKNSNWSKLLKYLPLVISTVKSWYDEGHFDFLHTAQEEEE